jgi:hypothetical protein
LGRLLLLFVILKPLTLIVLSLAGSAAAAGLSFGSGVPASVGTILSAVVIFGLAAFAPWALMHLLAADADSAHTASGLRTAAGAAVLDTRGRSVRSGGGLMAAGGDGGPTSPRGGGGVPGGSGPPGDPSGGAGSASRGPSGAGSGGGAGHLRDEDTLPLGAELGASGSVGVAAGMNASDGIGASEPGREALPRGRTSAARAVPPQEEPGSGASEDRGGGQVIALPQRGPLVAPDEHERERDKPRGAPGGPPSELSYLHHRAPARDDSPEDGGAA